MQPNEAKAVREAKGMTVREVAAVFLLRDLGGRIVRKWEAGEQRIPGPAQVCYRMLAAGHLDQEIMLHRGGVEFQRARKACA